MRRALGLGAAVLLSACSSEAVIFDAVGGGGGVGGGTGGGGTTTGGSSSVAQGGSGGALACQPGNIIDCYSGPAGTEDVGICNAGTMTCNAEGTGYGPCIGEVTPATEDCRNPADEDCDGAAPTCNPGAPLWAKRFGDPAMGLDETFFVALDTDAFDNVIVAASMNGVVDFGGGPLTASSVDVFVAKLDAQGNHQWSKGFGSSWEDWIRGVAVGQSNVVWLTGDAGGPIDFGGGVLPVGIFVAKLDAAGSHLWSNTFVAEHANAIAVTPNGGVIIAGSFQGTLSLGGPALTSAGANDIFLAQLDAQGNHLWSMRFGDAGGQTVRNAVLDAAGNIFVTGDYNGAPDFGGGPLPYVTSGIGSYVMKLTANGAHLWSHGFGGGSNGASFFGITTDLSGDVWVGGWLVGSVNFGGGTLTAAGQGYAALLVELSAAGSHLASTMWGDDSSETIYSLAADGGGSVALGGDFSQTIDFGGGALTSAGVSDIFVAKLSGSHAHVFGHSAGASSTDTCYAVCTDSGNHVLAGGRFSGTIDFGTGPLTSGSGTDLFVVKFDP